MRRNDGEGRMEQPSTVGTLADAGIGEPIQQARVRITPDGRLSAPHAAVYLGRAKKTLAMWRCKGIGARYLKISGRIFYRREELDRFIEGENS